MKLLVITPEHTTAAETDIANQLLAAGLHRLHIRKPSFSAADYRQYISSIDTQYHSCLCIHGSYELYSDFGLGGIHLSSHARLSADVWPGISHIPAAAISTSFHSWQEVADNTFPYGYAFISPVFDSISKAGYTAAIDLGGAAATRQQLAKAGKYCPQLVGLGGVGHQQAQTLAQHGFDGAAMLGSIWLSEDPVAEFLKIKAAVNPG